MDSTLHKSGLKIFNNASAIRTFLDFNNSPSVFSRALALLGGRVDVFSLDLDGQDYWILEPLTDLNAKIVVVDYQSFLGHDLALTVPRSPNFDRTREHFSWTYYGASLSAFSELLSLRGYKLIGTNRQRSNAFFVKEDLVRSGRLDEVHVPSLKELCDGRGGSLVQETVNSKQSTDRNELTFFWAYST